MIFKRYTKESIQAHPDQKITYHVPMSRVENFEMKTFGGNTFMYGEMVNKLGKYEDLGDPNEIAKKLGIKASWTK